MVWILFVLLSLSGPLFLSSSVREDFHAVSFRGFLPRWLALYDRKIWLLEGGVASR